MKPLRDSAVFPGYDCIYGPCQPPCEGHRGWANNSHGIHGDEWCYGIAAPDLSTALVITVFTDIFPPTVPADHSMRCGVICRVCRHGAHEAAACKCGCPSKPLHERRHGSDLTLHIRGEARPGVNTALRMFGGDFVCDRDLCLKYTSGLQARAFFHKHGDPAQAQQTEAFWEALEQRWQELDRSYRDERGKVS